MKLDLLVFAAHPDDAELSCGGTIAKYVHEGKKVGIVDLTAGELGTRGSKEIRYRESLRASEILGIAVRENLQMQDGFFKNDEVHQRLIIKTIRKYQPTIVLANAYHDRHPDHGRASDLIGDALFLCALPKIKSFDELGVEQMAWKPNLLLHYIQDRFIQPNIVLDVSDYFDLKLESIKAYRSQFYDANSQEQDTYISSPDYLDAVVARARELGKHVGVRYAEGFLSRKLLGVSDIFQLQ